MHGIWLPPSIDHVVHLGRKENRRQNDSREALLLARQSKWSFRFYGHGQVGSKLFDYKKKTEDCYITSVI